MLRTYTNIHHCLGRNWINKKGRKKSKYLGLRRHTANPSCRLCFGVLCNSGKNTFVTTTMEVSWEYECLGEQKKVVCFSFSLHVWMCLDGRVTVEMSVWARPSPTMTGICNSKHLGADNRKEFMLTIVKALATLVRYSPQHSGRTWMVSSPVQ